MKTIQTTLLALMLAFTLAACDKKSEPILSNNKDSIKDATDSRPHEATRDAVESTGDAIKKEAGDAKDAVKDATK